MEVCPNCGAQIGAGAKFCTTCGFRLTDQGAEKTVSETDQPTMNEGGEDVAAPTDDPTVAATIATGEPWLAGTTSGTGDDERSSPTTAATDDVDQPAAATEAFPEWPNNSGGPEVATTVQAIDAQGATDAFDPTPPLNHNPEPTTATPADDADLERVPWPNSSATDQAPLASTWARFAPPNEAPTALSLSTPDSDPADDRAQRARDLLRELGGLIDALTDSSPHQAPTLDGIIQDLVAARDQASRLSADSFGGLRSTLTVSRDRPRDIDTMIDLAGHLDEIMALQEAFDSYEAVIERTLAALQRSEEAPSDR